MRSSLMSLAGFATVAFMAASLTACPSKTTEPHEVKPSGKVDSAKPANGKATLLLMADIRGVLRPCGCTLDLQKGGFDRLAPHIAAERKAHPDAQLIHAGPLFFEKAKTEKKKVAQRERQSEVAADLVAKVGFAVAGATEVDVIASKGRYDALVKRAKLDITVANMTLANKQVPPYVVRKIGDLKVGIFALAAKPEGEASGLAVKDPKVVAADVVKSLSGKADVIVLLSSLGLRNTKRLVRAVEGIHFAVAGGLGEHPVASDEAELVGKTRVMQFHREGRFIGRLTLNMVGGALNFVDASAPSKAELAAVDTRIKQLEDSLKKWEATKKDAKDHAVRSARHHLASLKTQRDKLAKPRPEPPADKSWFSFVATDLPWDLPQDPDILKLMDAFDEELKKINLAQVGTLPKAKPGEAVYVGVDTCLECHEDTQHYWDNDRHKKAWETLEANKKTFDAECVSCHVTGYGKAGGSILGKTKGREDVQCEACHGPGSIHAEADEADAKTTIVRAPTAKVCTTCHNKHHSPNFDFRTYKAKLMVPGHGKPLAKTAPKKVEGGGQ